MGTTYANWSRAEMVESLLKSSTVVAKAWTGNNLWVVWGSPDASGQVPFDNRVLTMFKCTKSGNQWGYKPIDEACGPAWYNCPKKLIDMTPEPTWAWGGQTWREKVAEQTAKRACAKTRKPGDILDLGYEASWPSIGLKGRYVQLRHDGYYNVVAKHNGQVYRGDTLVSLAKDTKTNATVITVEEMN